ncbi:hypothetical protein H6F43_03085 [Leptolyngbya sp. FACHB-36]|uniref:hypothetical protein n=1 Tax=Leptolyngbya sp. FACHB-36 TaxID=2692808 RepID=UPI0016816833|nr:hypothetical protein [Leptolyngbya sp. FACHB-36]MBD2019168.1 hypothetical protein [Leptolyngbya sp. FACHB-36]
MDDKLTPIGNPLPREALLKLADFTQADLDQAIKTANKSLKPFLQANSRES